MATTIGRHIGIARKGAAREMCCAFCEATFPVWERGPGGLRQSWRQIAAEHVRRHHPRVRTTNPIRWIRAAAA